MCNRLNIRLLLVISCFQWFKDTKMKANHNNYVLDKLIEELFPMVQRYKNESKSQLSPISVRVCSSCFQWFKDTEMKANHNVCACLCVFVFQR